MAGVFLFLAISVDEGGLVEGKISVNRIGGSQSFVAISDSDCGHLSDGNK